MKKVQTSLNDQPCKHLSCNVYLKSKPDLRNTVEFKCYCIIKFVYVYVRSLQVWQGLQSLFFLLQNCFYIKLLIITFIRICDVQY